MVKISGLPYVESALYSTDRVHGLLAEHNNLGVVRDVQCLPVSQAINLLDDPGAELAEDTRVYLELMRKGGNTYDRRFHNTYRQGTAG